MGAESREAQIRTVKISGRTTPHRKSKPQESSAGDLIRQVLSGLADLAINADLSMGEMAELAKEAYVAAASQRARRASGTINRSRIAAITGLSRAEVAELLRAPSNRAARDIRSRARRVVDGWRQDRRFSTRTAVPKPLSLQGGVGSFEHLVRLYAGDVPPRAMLERLIGLSLVVIERPKRNDRGVVQLRTPPVPHPIKPEQVELLQAFSGALSPSKSSWIATLTVPTNDAIQHAILRKTIAEKSQVLLSGIEVANPRQRRSERALTVFVGMADVLDSPARAPSEPERLKRRKK